MAGAASDATTYVALLRGINLGRRRVAMADLRAAFERIGVAHPRTLQAAGTVVFEASSEDVRALTQRIEAGLQDAFGYQVDTLLRTVDEVRALAGSDPFAGIEVTPDTRLYASFLDEPLPKARQKPPATPDEHYRVVQVSKDTILSVVTVAPGAGTLDLMALLEKAFGKRITTRNWNTVLKLLPMMEA